MDARETYNLEFKAKISDSFLKTVSAFANYNNGEIIFGVDDNGNSLNLGQLKEMALRIENKVNDHISPRPDFSISIDEDHQRIVLRVLKGDYRPYWFKNRAYMRRDASSLPIEDREELKRLTLEGMQQSYEDLPSREQELSFKVLEHAFKQRLKIEKINTDILKTLGLYSEKKGYNLAADLVADTNSFIIMDIVKFGRNINEMMERVQIEHVSILSAYQQAIEMYRRYYQYELIDGAVRKKLERIPEDAFREAVANALVHRDWSLRTAIRVEMHDEYIQVASPGGLPSGISREEYINGQVSILRNEKIGSLFNRLGLIERFGTGIRRIRLLYSQAGRKPDFEVSQNVITVVLPLMVEKIEGLSAAASELLQALPANTALSRKEIETLGGFDKSKTLRLLDELLSGNCVQRSGKGRGTRYRKQAE